MFTFDFLSHFLQPYSYTKELFHAIQEMDLKCDNLSKASLFLLPTLLAPLTKYELSLFQLSRILKSSSRVSYSEPDIWAPLNW